MIVTEHAVQRLEERFYNQVLEDDPLTRKQNLLLDAVKDSVLLGESIVNRYYYGSIDGEADCIIVVRKSTDAIVTVLTTEEYINQR